MSETPPDLNEALYHAILQKQLEKVKELLAAGADPNRPHPSQTPALHWAASYGNLEMVKELLAAGADINGIDNPTYEETPLFKALRNRQSEIALFLLNNGAKHQLKNNWGDTPLHLAAGHSSLPLLEILIGDGLYLNRRNQYGVTPLQQAARLGDLVMLKGLIAAGADPDKKSAQGQNALVLSVISDSPEVFEYLRALSRHDTPKIHRECLKMALQYYRPNMTAHLLQDEDLAGPLNPGHPLLLALPYGYEPILKLFQARGIDLNAQNSQGDTVLMMAIEANWSASIQWLLKNGADPQLRNLQGQTALAKALEKGNLQLTEWLLKGIQDPDSCLPPGQSCLALAQRSGNADLVRVLLLGGAQIGKTKAQTWVDNALYLHKASKLMLAPGQGALPLPGQYLVGLQKNIESLGFVLSPALAERVLTLSEPELKEFYFELIPLLKQMVGAHKNFNPMYPNFPEQVMNMPKWELQLNALLHYWGDAIGKRILPHYEKAQRPALQDETPLKQIDLGDNADFMLIFKRLQLARMALSPEDKKYLAWFVASRGEGIVPYLEAHLPQRENAALLLAALLQHLKKTDGQTNAQTNWQTDLAANYLKNGTDVLRLATALSNGDVSLAENTRFVSFSKPIRRLLLGQLERMEDLAEALQKRPEPFKRLAERLHPGEYKTRFPKAFEAFKALRQGQKLPTFGRSVEMALAEREISTALVLLQTRPGEFARRLDHLLRLSTQAESVLGPFAQLANGLPSPLLLQVMAYFQGRLEPSDLRVFFPKGEVAKLQAIDNTLPPLADAVCEAVITSCKQALVKQYGLRTPLGKVYLDTALKAFKVPFALRSASKALRTVARGSRVELGVGETVRFFIWWKDGISRTDLDLSALSLNANFEYKSTLAYYNLKEIGGCHSGDITSAPEGASEFIDIHIPTFLSSGSRYLLMVVSSFTEQPYCDLPECFAGVMQRQFPNSGEIYEPRTVLNKFDLSANTQIAIPLILDLETQQMIWTDLALKKNPNHANHVHGNRSSLSLLCQAMTQLQKPSLYQLLELQIDARGSRVYNREEADTIFSLDQGITPWDTDRIVSDFL
ncbi:MAG: ankyrin repeat domain-containing protein [Candidatus Sericytochromatia bacterium]|nr:ankyrin repeat domain-containing protein [Candidatus Sericytochromatia bacterium]